MYLKVIGVLIVVTACSLMGFALANEYIAKINNLDAFKKSLRILKGKIKYDNLSVFEAMELIKINNNVIENFYHKVSKVYFMEEKTLFESWKMAVNKYLKKEIKFDKQETDVILTFGTNLGVTDRETQLSNIDECINDIQEVILQLKEEKNNKCKLYKCLGTFSGILIAVLLI